MTEVNVRLRKGCVGLMLAQAFFGSAALGAQLSDRALDCLYKASERHRVNANIMIAIARHESRGNPNAVVSNSNGSRDVGLTGINSVHLTDLSKYGIGQQDLTDECVSAYVGAWHLAAKMRQFGNTMQAVGAYHSTTPYYNARYQILIYNELVDMGVLTGSKTQPVPPLRPRASSSP